MKTGEVGRLGETLAAKYLESKGYTVRERNYRTGHLELDLICEDALRLIFVEVKTRIDTGAPSRLGRPARAVDARKRQHLTDAAEAYLRAHPSTKRKRIDVIEVCLYPDGSLMQGGIRHIENALL
ncbi:MAG: YraN family protein [Clostridia bacterium]|nr:YraN family protein [Clostridia bacterium]